jgi:hypothetical protein
MQYHKAKVLPSEQINLDRESKNTHDRRAIRVENGRFEPVGYLPRNMASWLAPLIDQGKIHLDGYVPQSSTETEEETSRCPLNLMVFQCEGGRCLFERAEPQDELEALHQTVLHAYQDAHRQRHQGYVSRAGFPRQEPPQIRQGPETAPSEETWQSRICLR